MVNRPTASFELIDAGKLVQGLNVIIPLADPAAELWLSDGHFDRIASGLVAGIPRPPGRPATYINRMLNADPLDIDGGMSWNILGLMRTPSEVSFTGGPLGRKISTADQTDGRLFLANFYFPIPEPGGLIIVAIVSVLQPGCRRRQRAR